MKQIITIGGGIAGMEASTTLAQMGYDVTIIEKEKQTGGKMNEWNVLFPNERPATEITDYIYKKTDNKNLHIIKGTSIVESTKNITGGYSLMTDKNEKLHGDAVLVSTGFEPFDATKKEEYGYSIYENVITSVDLENMLRKGQPILTSKGKKPKRIAFIHCVGSRDAKCGNKYCSRVCCVTGIKQAIECSRQLPDSEMFCFYMDIRMFGLEWEKLYQSAQEEYNVQFIRGRMSEACENQDESLIVKAEDTLSGLPLKMKVDLIVLLVGITPGKGTLNVASVFSLKREENGFLQIADPHFGKNYSSKKGIFLTGTCTGPMTVDETLENARSAAVEIDHYLTKKSIL